MLGPQRLLSPLVLAAGAGGSAASAAYWSQHPEGMHRLDQRNIPDIIDDVFLPDATVQFKKYVQPVANTIVGLAKFGAVGGGFALAGPLGAGAVALLGGALGAKSLWKATEELNLEVSPERGNRAISRGRQLAQQLWLFVHQDPAFEIPTGDKQGEEREAALAKAYASRLKELDKEIAKLDYIVPRLARIQRSVPAMLLYVPEKLIALQLRSAILAPFLAGTQHYVRFNSYRHAFHRFRATLPNTYEEARIQYPA